NNQQITARTPLRHNDKVRICDFLAQFLDAPPPLPRDLVRGGDEEEAEEEADGSSTVEATLSHSSNLILEQQPAEKLRTLLEISSTLSKTLDLDPLLPQIVDSLFTLFRQADRCFVILSEDDGAKLIPKVIKTRRPADEANARFSRSIVRKCLETAQAFLSDDASADKRIALSQSVVDFRIRSVMCAPLVGAQGKAFGVIQLDTQDRSKKFTQGDLTLLLGVVNVASIALENARLHEDQVRQAKVKRDLELAHQVQLSFLPQKLPEVPGYEFFAHYESAQEVGGDYYGFAPAAGGQLAIAIGDVAGKGVAAALLMAKLSSDTRFSLSTEPELPRAVAKLNALLYPQTSQMDKFVTLAGAVLDPARHTVTMVNAGHMAPLWYHRATGRFEDAMTNDQAGMPLGILDEQEYPAARVALEPGDCLLLFTDGVTDAQNVRKESFQAAVGVAKALGGGGPYTPRSLTERLVRAVKTHSAGCPQHDDITLVCLGRTGA
ncbi:MAG TPA: GAF domain-containing SpoIIE family protein phosphatase, partial [Gemmataceae bacterium]|nr:GAF domain-containing SpoIIE family protein phosphatase [Gemmataceae bacterium]